MKQFIKILICITLCFGISRPARASLTPKIAVTYFTNTSQDDNLNVLATGLSEMLITDLSVSKEITLVERSRLNDLLNEINLQENPYFNAQSAAKLGQGLGASYIITGSYLLLHDNLRIDARVIDVQTSEVGLSIKAEGPVDTFFAIQKDLAGQLLSGLGATLSMLENKKIGLGNTKNFDAFQQYSLGLQHLDNGDSDAAKLAFENAKKIDPNFALVDEYLTALQARSQQILLESADKDQLVIEEVFQRVKHDHLTEEDCAFLTTTDTIMTFSLMSSVLWDKSKLTDPAQIERNLGALHQLVFKLLDPNTPAPCQNYNQAYFGIYEGILQNMIHPKLELKKAMIFEMDIESAKKRAEFYYPFNLRDENGDILFRHDQLITLYFQLADALLQSPSFNKVQKTRTASFIDTYSIYLLSDNQQAIQDRQMVILAQWLQHSSTPQWYLYSRDGYYFQISTGQQSFTANGLFSGVDIGWECKWIWPYIKKIEIKELNGKQFVEYPKIQSDTVFQPYCSHECNINKKWSFCDKESGPFGPIPEDITKNPEMLKEIELRKCLVSENGGWVIKPRSTPLKHSDYASQIYAAEHLVMEQFPTEIQWRVTLIDNTQYIVTQKSPQ